MKKSLLMVAVLFLTAMGFVNAQEDSVTWMLDAYCVDLSLEADAVALTPGQEITVGAVTFTAREKSTATGWLYKPTSDAAFDYDGVTYTAGAAQGQTNPKDGKVEYDGDKVAIGEFVTTTAGELDIAFKYGYNKRFWVAAVPVDAMDDLDLADSTAVAQYAYAYEINGTDSSKYWGGYFDGTGSYFFSLEKPATEPDPNVRYTGISLDMVPDINYYVWFSGSKLQLAGLTYVKAKAATYMVSGTVKMSDATPVEGVLISSSDGQSATTDANGGYLIKGIPAGSLTLTPSKTDYTFTPESISLTMDKNYVDQNFVAEDGTSIFDQVSNATVVSTVYYNIVGQKFDKPQYGALNIVVKTMSDGSMKTEKMYIKE